MRIRRGVGSRRLPCGCLAGVYETYNDEIVTIIDAHAAYCDDPAHTNGYVLPLSHEVLTPARSGGWVKR